MSVRRAGSMLEPPKDQIEVGERILACEFSVLFSSQFLSFVFRFLGLSLPFFLFPSAFIRFRFHSVGGHLVFGWLLVFLASPWRFS